ncbi:MAG: hypothetical protein J6B32_00065 [Spirochaetaceae bacterium]|nr:hypothetical protein [Spirochaetaceae bacterium]MBO5235494.1 hypothetical protein [Spirochaetaceae bacterium]
MAEKHVNYFALQKACENKGCPICRIIDERIDRYIDGMLFEHISDRTFRAQYREAGGFCSSHAKILLNYRDGLAVAILGQGTLDDYIHDFKKRKMRRYKQLCPACAEQQRIEKEFLTFIAEGHDDATSDQELREFFCKSDGLCVPHYSQLVKILGRKIPKWLSNFQEDKFSSLIERTKRFIDYSAWGKQKEFASLSEEDKVVWKELASILRGQIQ